MKFTLFLLPAALVLGSFAPVAFAETHVSLDLHLGLPAPVIVREAPPAPIVVQERQYPAPGPGYVWIPGHHIRHHDHWVWVGGTWALPPQPGAFYVEGRWDERSHNWIESHWEYTVVPAPQVVEFSFNEPPPPPRPEIIVVRPSPYHVWIAGYWVRHGHHQEWIAGHWELPPHGHHEWIAPRWEHRGGSYVFIEGSWR